jgi:hypothetical protein
MKFLLLFISLDYMLTLFHILLDEDGIRKKSYQNSLMLYTADKLIAALDDHKVRVVVKFLVKVGIAPKVNAI